MSRISAFNAFDGANVLVTGSTGFIGKHLVNKLSSYGAQVLGLSRTDSPTSSSLNVDVTSLEQVLAAFDQSRKKHGRPVDYIFHLAGQKNFAIAHRYPRETLELSIQGTTNILEAARLQESKVRKVVIVSSLAVYGTIEDQTGKPVKEDHVLGGDSIYSVSKIASEYIGKSYWREFSTPTVIARLANVYGPGQSPEAVISSIIQQMLANQGLKLGNTQSVRDFTYVEDTAEAMMALSLAEGINGQALNVGSGLSCSIDQIVQTVAELTGFNGAIQTDADRVRAQEKSVFLPDVNAFMRATDWKPKHTLKAGLARTVEAFRSQLDATI